jgi:hypothetical protein
VVGHPVHQGLHVLFMLLMPCPALDWIMWQGELTGPAHLPLRRSQAARVKPRWPVQRCQWTATR